ncbi:hypothetical protein [Pleionea sediminis]|uniref:hypothetical protein n=1 Tax=Pleionea sediminis TaxID=2569479 RepID=UPI001184FB42|nr:hypothetical protein [Pleionea sediminis]
MKYIVTLLLIIVPLTSLGCMVDVESRHAKASVVFEGVVVGVYLDGFESKLKAPDKIYVQPDRELPHTLSIFITHILSGKSESLKKGNMIQVNAGGACLTQEARLKAKGKFYFIEDKNYVYADYQND